MDVLALTDVFVAINFILITMVNKCLLFISDTQNQMAIKN